jgi:hypothetical protein
MIIYKLKYDTKEQAILDIASKEIIGKPVFIDPIEPDEVWDFCLVDVASEIEQTFLGEIKNPEIAKHNFL